MIGQGDDMQAFTALYQRHVTEIYRYILIRTGGETGPAEDLTQDVFLDACRGFSRFRKDSSERTWLFRIARNKVIDWYRGDARTRREALSLETDDMQALPDPAQDWETVLESLSRSDEVLDCLRALPPQYRMVLLLKHVEHCSVRDIARWMDRTPKAVDGLLQRAKAQFVFIWKRNGMSRFCPKDAPASCGRDENGEGKERLP